MNTPTLYVARRDGELHLETRVEVTNLPDGMLQLRLDPSVGAMTYEEWQEFSIAVDDMYKLHGQGRH